MPVKFLESVPVESREIIARLCLIWFLVITVWSTHAALIPLLVKSLVGTAEAAWWQGVFTSTTAVSGTLFCSFMGYSSDRLGRREMLVPWIIAFVCAAFSVAMGEYFQSKVSVYFLWVPRVVAISIPSTVLHAYAADLARGGSVLEAHGLLGASFGSSLLVGSIICGLLATWYSRLVAFTFAAIVACVSAVVVFTLSPKSRKEGVSGNASATPTPYGSPTTGVCAAQQLDTAENGGFHRLTNLNSNGPTTGYEHQDEGASPTLPKTVESFADGLRLIQRDGLLRCLVFAFALVRAANVNSYFMFVLFVNYRLGWEAFDAAVSFGVIGVLGVFWQAFGIRYIVQRHDNVVPFLLLSLGCFPALMFGYGVAATTTQMYAVAIVGSVCSIATAIIPAKITILAAESGASGFALGLVGSLQNVMEIFMALLFGELLRWALTTYQPEDFALGTPYFVNATLYVVALLLVVYGHKKYGKARANWIGHHDERLFS